MPKYNIFEEHIDESVRGKHDLLMAQTQALFDASNLISEAMDFSSMSQKELSEHLGISKGYVSRLLSGTENVSLKNLARILHLLGYKLNLSMVKTVADIKDNVIWADFGKTGTPVRLECSVTEDSSPWSEIIQRVI